MSSVIVRPAVARELAAALSSPGAVSPERSGLFTRWTDPVSGVESWILSRRVAPIQQSFYFVNPSFSDDGRYLWLFCSFPPGGDAYYGRQLAVIDFEQQAIRHYPETQFADASPGVDTRTGEVYWTTGLEVWKRGPRANDQATRVNAFPADLAHNRRPLRLATHLTFSADRKSVNIDALFGDDCFIGELPLDGGDFRLWQKFDRCYNHAQFSPTDPDVQLLAQDGWFDAGTGAVGVTHDRLWLIRRGEQARQICPDTPSDMRGHEWWDVDGKHVWYIDYRKGTERVNIETGVRENIWPSGHTHSHCDRDAKYLVGDVNPGASDQWRVAFFNRATGREIDIVSRLLPLPHRTKYHVHPHPQFSQRDRYICYTTNVLGTIDLALVSVEHLVALTG